MLGVVEGGSATLRQEKCLSRAASLSCPGSYPNGNLYEQKSNHFRDLDPQSLLNLMSISLKFQESQGEEERACGKGLWILEEVSRNLLSRCLRAKPAAYSATAGTPQAWLGLVGREGGRGQSPERNLK